MLRFPKKTVATYLSELEENCQRASIEVKKRRFCTLNCFTCTGTLISFAVSPRYALSLSASMLARTSPYSPPTFLLLQAELDALEVDMSMEGRECTSGQEGILNCSCRKRIFRAGLF